MRPLFAALGGLWLILIAASITQDVLGVGETSLRTVLDLDSERSLYTWFSQVLLALSGALLAVISQMQADMPRLTRARWLVFSGLLFFASLDETIGIHEHISMQMHQALHTEGLLFFPWTIPYGLAVAVGLLAAIPLFRSLPRRTAIRFGVAAAIYLSGAIGCEMISGLFVDDGVNFVGASGYRVMMTIEESLEGLGGLVFLHALLAHLQGLADEM